MRSFIKIVLGSCLGVIVAILAIGFIGSFAVGSMLSLESQATSVKQNSVLRIKLNKPVPQKTNNTEAMFWNLSDDPLLGERDIIESIKAARTDNNIKGIYLTLSLAGIGNATAKTIRSAIVDFKESGKFVYAYCGNYGYSQGAYYLASAADKVFLHPMGSVDVHGFGAEIPFFKDMLDKMGVKMTIFYAGKFKSATEPFRLNQMSEENRLQVKSYMNELYSAFLADISDSRNLSTQKLHNAVSNLSGRTAEMAMESGLVDDLKFEDEVFEELKRQLDLDEDDDINFIELPSYHSSRSKDRDLGADSKIAVLYAEGEIRAGGETYGTITDDHYVEMIRKIGDDDKVRAVVLRVNSPGGDAFVSDEIWRALEVLQEKDIVVVASMADVAASGGYYIACGTDRIVAEPNTITGSIGVFGMVPNVQELFNDKLGIHMDTVKTAPYGTGVVSPFYAVGEEERQLMQENIDQTYTHFLERVAEGRKMTVDEVHEVAQGRVWTGKKAWELGLVDEMGDLEHAIQVARELAGIEDYRLTEYPRIKDPMQKLIEDLTGTKVKSAIQDQLLNHYFPTTAEALDQWEYLYSSDRPMARLPFNVPSL